MIIAAFDIRHLEKVPHSRVADFAETNKILRPFYYDLRELPTEDGTYHDLNPYSDVLEGHLNNLVEMEFLKREVNSTRGVRSYKLLEKGKNIVESLRLVDEYEKIFSGTYSFLQHSSWRREIQRRTKDLVHKEKEAYNVKYGPDSKKYIEKLLSGICGLAWHVGKFLTPMTETVAGYISGKISDVLLTRQALKAKLEQSQEKLIHTECSKESGAIVCVTGYCTSVWQNDAGDVEIKLFLGNEPVPVFCQKDGFLLNPLKLESHSLEVIGITSRRKGEDSLTALKITDLGWAHPPCLVE